VFTATARGFVPGRQAARVSMGRSQAAVEIRLPRPVEIPTVLGDIDAGALQAELAQARALLTAGKHEDAIAAWRAVLARVPALTALHLQIAQAHRQAGDYDAAMAACRSAITGEDRVSERARVDLAIMEIERGKLLLQRLP
jgi:tetratricopeptide (TPR) repeat protein